ncbi:MAG: hypothetical protein HON70_27450 [Lentisphaerae bacterium]|jgi:hypothetical protein|nr:hypothetical protein [Lentisphaerota bacterium]
MKPNTMNRTTALVIAFAGMLMLAATGCKSTRTLSQTEMQARLAAVTEQVRLAQVRSGSPVMADFLSNVPDSGAAGYTQVKRVVRNPDGTPLILPNGQPAMEGGVAVGLLNSMRDFGNVDQAWLVLGGWARNPLTGEVSRDATLDGLFTYVTGGGVASTVNSEFAAVWAAAPAAEKAAAAEAVRLALEVRKGMIVDGITATGEAARGILREVYRATPAGAGLAAVEVLLDSNGQQIPATVTEPFRTLPSTSGGGTDQ